jgi:hypothetical protein
MKREGGKYELAGFLIILAGMARLVQFDSSFAWEIMGFGLLVFLVGRFKD